MNLLSLPYKLFKVDKFRAMELTSFHFAHVKGQGIRGPESTDKLLHWGTHSLSASPQDSALAICTIVLFSQG